MSAQILSVLPEDQRGIVMKQSNMTESKGATASHFSNWPSHIREESHYGFVRFLNSHDFIEGQK